MKRNLETGAIMNSEAATASTRSQLQDLSGSPFLGAVASLGGRILLSAIFLISGFGKLAAPAGAIEYIAAAGLPFPQLAFGIAVVLEIVGGLALIAGYRTRFVAAALAVFCLATAFGFHNQLADQNQFVHFFKNIAMAGGLLQVIAFGAGRFSIDARNR
jgi:putative oxidoreductase